MITPIKTKCGITVHFTVERIHTLRVYVARACITGESFCLDSWRDLDKRKLKRATRKGLELIKIRPCK